MSLLENLIHLLPRRSARAISAAETALGVDHPLCQSERELASAALQLLGTAMFVVSVAAFARFHTVGGLMFVGVATLTVVSVRVTTAFIRRDLRTVEAIASGLEGVPSAHVRRVRARLLRRRERERIAASLASYVRHVPASRPSRPTAFVPPAIAADGAQDELRAVIALLRGDPPSAARGVAVGKKLLSDYPSALYGEDARALRAELGRIRFLLSR